MNGLAGKTVLVTGASSGIGRAIAVRFATEGSDVAINYARDVDGANGTAKGVADRGVRACIVKADVASDADVAVMFEHVIRELGGIDILVNNAGIQVQSPSHEMPMADFDRVIAVNLRGAFACARRAITHFIERGKPGCIVNVTSVHEEIPKPGYPAYVASKGGMRALTRTLALEYASKGIRVNNVAPGAIITRMNEGWALDEIKRKAFEQHVPLGYIAEPEDVAPAVAFLASDEARYITGITLSVDGGAMLHPDRLQDWLAR